MTTSWGQGFPWERAGLGPDAGGSCTAVGTSSMPPYCSPSRGLFHVMGLQRHETSRGGKEYRNECPADPTWLSPWEGVNGADRMHYVPAEDGHVRGCRCHAAYETGATPGAPAPLSKAVPSQSCNLRPPCWQVTMGSHVGTP